MTQEQNSLHEKLKTFELDNPDASFSFSDRLALENNWSLSFTHRAIDEYKRFVFLSVFAGHPITPSDAIDEVWHLHLLYTQSYWNKLCGEILQKPFHHNPTEGGQKEANKFDDWYTKTLESYEKFFGETPPEDIWPSPETRAKTKLKIKIDRNQFILIRKPKILNRK